MKCVVLFVFGKNSTRSPLELRSIAENMAHKLMSRGPDGFGMHIDQNADIALGHRRLSIVDLPPVGHQPIRSYCGRYALAFTGEIYNHAHIRAELSFLIDHKWQGHSDSETLLVALSFLGLLLFYSGLIECFLLLFGIPLSKTFLGP